MAKRTIEGLDVVPYTGDISRETQMRLARIIAGTGMTETAIWHIALKELEKSGRLDPIKRDFQTLESERPGKKRGPRRIVK